MRYKAQSETSYERSDSELQARSGGLISSLGQGISSGVQGLSSMWSHAEDSVDINNVSPTIIPNGITAGTAVRPRVAHVHPNVFHDRLLDNELSVQAPEKRKHVPGVYAREKAKTTAVGIYLCLNVSIDPPDLVKPSVCSRKICWVDPNLPSNGATKDANKLGHRMEKLVSRTIKAARVKSMTDPDAEQLVKSAKSLRRNAKHDRAVVWYNGYGVPKPTTASEIWAFNSNMTQYLPVALNELQASTGTPSIYVFDCNQAGTVLPHFYRSYARRPESASSAPGDHVDYRLPLAEIYSQCLVLTSCGAQEYLPLDPKVPADLFTVCLLDPVRTLLMWYMQGPQGILLPGVTEKMIENIPGTDLREHADMSDRRTIRGEIQWGVSLIVNVIMWNSLPRDIYCALMFTIDNFKLHLVRHFFMAQRVMSFYGCMPNSFPALPNLSCHPAWEALDYILDSVLRQLPTISETNPYKSVSYFHMQQLTFSSWLDASPSDTSYSSGIFIVNMLLSQLFRDASIKALNKFMELGPWAVADVLCTSFPWYAQRLLQSSEKSLYPSLVRSLSKMVSYDPSLTNEMLRDNHANINVDILIQLIKDPVPVEAVPGESSVKSLAAFILMRLVEHCSVFDAKRRGHDEHMPYSHQHSSSQPQVMESPQQFANAILNLAQEVFDTTFNLAAANQEVDQELLTWTVLSCSLVYSRYPESKAMYNGSTIKDIIQNDLLGGRLPRPQPRLRAAVVNALGAFVGFDGGEPHTRFDLEVRSRLETAQLLVTFAADDSSKVRIETVAALSPLLPDLTFEVQMFQQTPQTGRGYFTSTFVSRKVLDSVILLLLDPNPRVAAAAETLLARLLSTLSSDKLLEVVKEQISRLLPLDARRPRPWLATTRQPVDHNRLKLHTTFYEHLCSSVSMPIRRELPVDDIGDLSGAVIVDWPCNSICDDSDAVFTARAHVETRRTDGGPAVGLTKFHPVRNAFYALSAESVSVWDYSDENKLVCRHVSPLSLPYARPVYAEFITNDVNLLTVFADGSLRLHQTHLLDSCGTDFSVNALTACNIISELQLAYYKDAARYKLIQACTWQRERGRLFVAHRPRAYSAVSRSQLFGWDADVERPFWTVTGTTTPVHITSLYHHENYGLLAGYENGVVELIPTNGGEKHQLMRHRSGGVVAISDHPHDTNLIISADVHATAHESSILLWDMRHTSQAVATHKLPIRLTAAAFHDRLALAASFSQTGSSIHYVSPGAFKSAAVAPTSYSLFAAPREVLCGSFHPVQPRVVVAYADQAFGLFTAKMT